MLLLLQHWVMYTVSSFTWTTVFYCSYSNCMFLCVAVPGRSIYSVAYFNHITLFKLSTVVQNFGWGWGSYALCRCVVFMHLCSIYEPRPCTTEVLCYSTLTAVNTIKIHNGCLISGTATCAICCVIFQVQPLTETHHSLIITHSCTTWWNIITTWTHRKNVMYTLRQYKNSKKFASCSR